jgi:hypothetical protein
MPVNIWLLLLPVLLIYLWCLRFLYRKAPKLAYAVLGLTLLWSTIFYLNTNVEKVHTRNMSWKIYDGFDGSVVELRDSGDSDFVTNLGSDKLAKHLKASGKESVPVELIEWYDFGHLRAYRIETIDGSQAATWTSADTKVLGK